MLRSLLPLGILYLVFGAGIVVTPCARAQDGGDVAVSAPAEGKFASFDGITIRITLPTEKMSTETVSPAARAAIEQKIKDGIVKAGNWVRLHHNVAGEVVDIEPIEAPAPVIVNPGGAALRKEVEASIKALARDDRFIFEDTKAEGVYWELRNNQVWYYPAGSKTLQLRSLKEIRAPLKRIAAAHVGPEAGPDPSDPKRLTPGAWYKFKDQGGTEYYGYVLSLSATAAVFQLHPSIEMKPFPVDAIHDIQAATPPEPAAGPRVGPGTPTGGPSADPVRVTLEPIDPARHLRYDTNRYVVGGKLSHAIQGKLLVGARVTVAFRGPGEMVPPERENEMLEAKVVPPGDGGFKYQEVQHFCERGTAGMIIAALADQTDLQTKTIADAVFPDLTVHFDVGTRIFQARVEEAPRVIYDAARSLIPFNDERAIPYLLKAYAERPDEERAAALRAMPQTANAKLLPFLVWEFYGEQIGTAGATRLAETIGRFHDLADAYLVGLVRDRGYEKEFVLPATSGAPERRQAPADADKMLARVTDLLATFRSQGASQYILPLTRSTSEVVRAAARRFFLDQDSVPWLARRLGGPSIAQAKLLLAEIEAKKPGTLLSYVSTSVKDGDAAQKLAGEPADVVLDWLVEYMQKSAGSAVDDDIAIAQSEIDALESQQVQITLLRRDLATAYVAAAIAGPPAGETEERRWQARLYRRAVALDPGNERARRELSAIFLGISAELQKGAYLRSGPGEEFSAKRRLKKGEAVTEVPPPEGTVPAPGWRYVKAADEMAGWIAEPLLAGKAPVIVVHDRRSLADRRRLLLLARAFYPGPGRNTEIESGLAEIAAGQAAEAGQAGDWRTAFERYRSADALTPGRYRTQLAIAYLRANPFVGALGVFAMVLFAVAIFGGHRGKIVKARAPAEAPAAAAKQVPS